MITTILVLFSAWIGHSTEVTFFEKIGSSSLSVVLPDEDNSPKALPQEKRHPNSTLVAEPKAATVFGIQFGTFRVKENAERLNLRLKKHDIATLVRFHKERSHYVVVLMQPCAANLCAELVRKSQISDSLIIRK